MDLTRRNFLTATAALAALAVVKDTGALLPRTDRERLLAQMRDGAVVRDQVFRIYDREPIVFRDISMTFENCTFYWVNGCRTHAMIFDTGSAMTLRHCVIKAAQHLPIEGAGMYFKAAFDQAQRFDGVHYYNNTAGWNFA